MWKVELSHTDAYDPKQGWYGKSLEYWSKTPATITGVLGGMDHVHEADIAESRQFLLAIQGVGRSRALDCGAGIGRITKNLLMPLFEKTDLLEPIPHMLQAARDDLGTSPKAGEFYLQSIEKFIPVASSPKYDVVVLQWVAIYLTDDDFVSFLKRMKASLAPNGIVFFKENVASKNEFVVDKDDSSLTRSDMHYKMIFAAAGMAVVAEAFQKKWPADLFAVKMYALR